MVWWGQCFEGELESVFFHLHLDICILYNDSCFCKKTLQKLRGDSKENKFDLDKKPLEFEILALL